jgi:hypothetical protein
VSGLENPVSFDPDDLFVLPSSANHGYGYIAVGPNGEVAVSFQNLLTGEGTSTVRLSVDPDGLGSGSFNTLGGSYAFFTTEVGPEDMIEPHNELNGIDAEVGVAWDRSTGPYRGRLYVIFTNENANETTDDTDVWLRYSTNAASITPNWSTPKKIHDDNAKSQFLPRIAVDQTTGNIAISWYDCRNDPGNRKVQFFATVSKDGGETFDLVTRIALGQSDRTQNDGGFDYGDYSGSAFHNGVFFPIWADNSNSTGTNPPDANGKIAFDIHTRKQFVP